MYTTYKCNLSCSFCYAKDFFRNTKKSTLTDAQINNIIKYISIRNKKTNDIIAFFGGEPLMEYQIIDNFIKKTKNLNIEYAVYTNGLLLNSVPLELLNSINVLFVSVDGDKKAQEYYKGKCTYDKVINNLKILKPKSNSFIIGRITADEETNIYISVTNLLHYTDAVHWQIVNKPEFKNKELFIKNYKKGIEMLFEYWLSQFRKDKILKIIPFQAIIASLIFNYRKNAKSFRCNAGSDLQTIDIDGNIYWCDEHVGNTDMSIGNITNRQYVNLQYQKHTHMFEDCKYCEFSKLCLGRCKKCLLEYSDQQNRAYCELTIHLIKTILKNIDEIKDIVEKNNYTLEQFFNGPYCTEEIP